MKNISNSNKCLQNGGILEEKGKMYLLNISMMLTNYRLQCSCASTMLLQIVKGYIFIYLD